MAACAGLALPQGTAACAETAAAEHAIRVTGHIEAGITFQPDKPENGINFGHLATDRANQPVFNQALLNIERPIDTAAKHVDPGFRVSLIYGSDARLTRLTGQFGGAVLGRTAFDVLEADFQAHLPVVFAGGIDIKLGQYVSPVGYEVIAATDTLLYSHGYILNFGAPIKHTGLLTISHPSRHVDVYAGVDSGTNTSILRDNNRAAGFLAGFGLNFPRVTFAALTHIGPEWPSGTPGVRPNRDLRYYSDAYVVWQVTDRLMAITEVNYVRDDGIKADGGGIAQYFAYTVSPKTRLALRAEVWRDSKGAYFGALTGTNDLYNQQLGRPNAAIAGSPTTYAELTLGVTRTFHDIGPLREVRWRPELRYDHALSGRPFNAGRRTDQFTLGFDVVIPFATGQRGPPT